MKYAGGIKADPPATVGQGEKDSLLHLAISNAPVLFFVIDKEGIVLHTEGKGLELLELKPEETIGASIFEIYRNVPKITRNIKKTLTGITFTSTVKVRNVYLDARHEPILDSKGNVVGVVGICIDVTQRHIAQQELQENYALLNSIIENTEDCITLKDLKGRFIMMNPACSRLLGLKSDDVVGKTKDELYLPQKMSDEIGEAEMKVLSEDRVITTEHELDTPAGKKVFSMSRGSIKDVEGRPTSIFGIGRDITERKLSEQRFSRLFHESPVSLWEEDLSEVKSFLDEMKEAGGEDLGAFLRSNPDYLAGCVSKIRVLDLNRATMEMFGARSKEEMLANVNKVFCEESQEALIEHLVHLAEGDTSGEIETIEQTLQGEQLNVVVKWHVPPGYEKTYSRVYVSIMDITQRKRSEEALKRYERIFSSSSDLMAYFDKDYICRTANAAFVRAMGKECLDRPLMEIWGKELFDVNIKHSLDACMRGEEARRKVWLEIGYLDKRHLDFAFLPYYEPDGSINGVIVNARDITELKLASNNLARSEQRFRALFEETPICITEQDYTEVIKYLESLRSLGVRDFHSYFNKNPDMLKCCFELARPINLNRAAKAFFRTDIENSQNRRFEFFLPETFRSFQGLMVALAEGRTNFEDETVCKGPDEEILNIVIKAMLLPSSPGGRVRTIIISFTDITDVRKAEKGLQESLERVEEEKAKTEGIISAMADGLSIIDKDYRVLFQNQMSMRIHGESIGRSCYEAYAKEDRVCDNCPVERTFSDGEVHSSEKKVLINNEEYFYEITTSPIKDLDGEIISVVEVTRDITKRHRILKAFEKSEENIRLLLDSTAEAIYEIDLEGKCVMCNPSCLRLLGYNSPEELIGRKMHEAIHHTRVDGGPCLERECRIYEGMYNGAGVHVEDEVFWKADGTSFPVEYWSYPIRRNDRITGAVVTFLDISERRRNEDIVQRALEEKDLLIKEINHRVKNNLTVLQSILRLQSGSMKDGKAKMSLKDSESRMRSMSMIHEQLYMTKDLKRIRVSSYVRRLVKGLHHSYMEDEKDVSIEVQIPEIRLDINTIIPLGLIINELVTNAFKYAFKRGREGRLILSIQELGSGWFELLVSDNGDGLPEGLEIYSARSLGMQIIISLVGDLNGAVKVSTTDGTEFRIRFTEADML